MDFSEVELLFLLEQAVAAMAGDFVAERVLRIDQVFEKLLFGQYLLVHVRMV